MNNLLISDHKEISEALHITRKAFSQYRFLLFEKVSLAAFVGIETKQGGNLSGAGKKSPFVISYNTHKTDQNNNYSTILSAKLIFSGTNCKSHNKNF